MSINDFSLAYESLETYLFNSFREDVLFYSIALAALIGKMKESSKNNLFTAWIMYFMGTLFHELSHFVVSFLTFGKPFWFSVIPSTKIDKTTGAKTTTLGYVKSGNIRWWNVFFVSMSPLLLLPFSFWVYNYFFNYFEESLWTVVLYIFSIVSLLFSSVPSGVDFKNVFNANAPINLLVPIIFFALYILFNQYYIIDFGGLF
jgi:hypothetical protein